MFDAKDEITCLALETNTFRTKSITRLMLKSNAFGAREELTHLVIETNTFGTGDEHIWRWRRTLNPKSSNLLLSTDLWKHQTYSLCPQEQVNKLNRMQAISPRAQG